MNRLEAAGDDRSELFALIEAEAAAVAAPFRAASSHTPYFNTSGMSAPTLRARCAGVDLSGSTPPPGARRWFAR